MHILSTWIVCDGIIRPVSGRASTDLTGLRFGRLLVVGRAPNLASQPRSVAISWRCECDCGAVIVASADNLRHGQISCGCRKGRKSRSIVEAKAEIRMRAKVRRAARRAA